MLTAIRKRLWLGTAAAVLLLSAGTYAVVVYRRAMHVQTEAESAVGSRGSIRFASSAMDRHTPEGFTWLGGGNSSGYIDAAVFQEHFFLLQSSELLEYDADGVLLSRFRSGLELPPSALVGLRAGAVTFESKQPELLVATSTSGYLAYDGKSWRHVRIDGQRLLSIHPLSNGRVLIGTERAGLLVHDARGLTPFHDSLTRRKVTAVAGLDESDLWFGTLDEGLFHYQGGQLQPAPSVPDKRVLWLEVDGVRVWAATPLGIAEYEGGRFRRELASGFFVKTLLRRRNALLAGTLEDGLLEIGLEARNPRPMRLEQPADRNSSSSDVRKVFAAGGREFTLLPDRLLSGDKEVIRADAGSLHLTDGNIAALAPDNEGRLWIGYFDRGLDILDGSRLKHLEDDTLFCVNRIVHDEAGRRSIVATGNGLAILDATQTVRKVMHKADGLIANHATDVLLRPGGNLTVATPAGVTFIEGGGRTSSIYAFHGLVNNHVYALGACQNQVLAGTLGGLSTLEGGLVKASFTTANSALRHNWITAIADAGTTCLVGTYGGAGVMAFDPDGTWRAFPDLTQPEVRGFEVNPNALAVTERAAFAGTLGRGLAVWNRGTGRWNWLTEGLPSLNVTAVAARGGSVYIGTDNGLVQVEERVLVR
jgi:hypothetical protein